MFDIIRNNNKIAQVILALIALTFIFGIDRFMRNGGPGMVAKIDDVKITTAEFQQELRRRQEMLREQYGQMFDAKVLDQPEVRRVIVNQMIDQRLLQLEAQKNRLVASDLAVKRYIETFKDFQENGKFSIKRYEAILKANQKTPAMYEAEIRQILTFQQLEGNIKSAVIPSKVFSDRTLAIQTEKREVAEHVLTVDSFLPKVKLAEDAAKKYYDAHPKEFETPEQVKAEYVVLSQENLAAQISPSETEIKEWYDKNISRYQTKDKLKSKHKAESILREVNKNPGDFANLAKKYSQDSGSASAGGDIGFYARGALFKSFEDTLFKLKEGEISGVVESDVGYHIIKLTGVRSQNNTEERRASHILIEFENKPKPLADVRAEIEAELKVAKAGKKFSESADEFRNMVYEQSDGFKPVADKFKLEIKQTDWIGKKPTQAHGLLANEKLLKSLFSEDSLKTKRNTEALELGQNVLISARVIEHKPAKLQTFDAVKAQIETQLKQKEALVMATKAGQEKLAALRKGSDEKLTWSAAKTVSYIDARAVPSLAMPPIFRTDVSKLPSYAGVEIPKVGYALYKVVKVLPAEKIPQEQLDVFIQQFYGAVAEEDMRAYMKALRSRHKIEIDQAALEAKESN